MTEEIIRSITEAEAQAAEIKAKAYGQAAQIAARAETRASEMAKSSEEVCKAYRETQLKAARADARKKYLETLDKKSAEAKAYAERLLENTELSVSEIVRRVCGGDC